MKDFAIAVVTEDHSRIETALSDARAGPAAHSLLPELFACLALALPDSHLSDRYSAALISTINSICRNCSEERKGSAGALKGL
ncbi:MAG TPA: hypothetical protein PKJ97_00955, partial [Candidatus Bilamarchaeaceae archaeon]|nr:hypothetical protein [Candidatus Bilamarchaeaceae archaeon]